MAKFTWQDGTLVSKAKVEIDGTIYEVDPEEYSGTTPLSASNLNSMQDGIYEDIDGLSEDLESKSTYSLNENVIGKWVDNKPIYRKVIEVPKSAVSASSVAIPHNISNLGTLVTARGILVGSTDFNVIPWITGGTYAIYLNDITSTAVNLNITQNAYNKIVKIFLILEYTKTTD